MHILFKGVLSNNILLALDCIVLLLITFNRTIKIGSETKFYLLMLGLSLFGFISRGAMNNAAIMEFKFLFILFLILFSPSLYISEKRLYRDSLLYSFLLFISIAYTLVTTKNRFDMGVVGEINYDLFIIGLVLLKLENKFLFNRILVIYLLLALLSMSRMNILIAMVLMAQRNKNFSLIAGVFVMSLYVVSVRGLPTSFSSVDRLVFISEWFSVMSSNINLGPSPVGLSLYRDSHNAIFDWYRDDMSARNNLDTGVYSFMFHFFIGRIFTQYGVILSLVILWLLRRDILNNKLFYVIALFSFSWIYILPVAILYTNVKIKTNQFITG